MSEFIGRGRLFFRAQYDDGRWGSVDVHDLDDESFRAVVLGPLSECFTLVLTDDDELSLLAKPGLKKED